ncbi:MAG: hypothetical protein FIA99_20075 [Ruminiclostridium sp.]|nr:hypothetical protein [Ruminiclostridium sp.]
MRIDSSAVSMAASSSYIEKSFKEESLKTWIGDKRPDFEGEENKAGLFTVPVDILELSKSGKASLEKQAQLQTSVVEDEDSVSFELSDKDKQKIMLIQKMLEALTGKKIKFVIMDRVKLEKAFKDSNIKIVRPQPQAVQRQGWGLEYDLHEAHYEKQKMSFEAQGVVRTADGREINFSLNLNMSREFATRTDISIRAGDAIKADPLVINLNNSAPCLTEQKFGFDLDNDGTAAQISFVTGGSGFLALDLNNDSIINNGSELFGPQSGNGFKELAEYDSDGNGWIDGNDTAYDKLRIWTKDENGADRLLALGQVGVGAIYLGNIDTAFSLKDSSNQLQGEIAKTGVYLKENGTAGTIQHIDLAI